MRENRQQCEGTFEKVEMLPRLCIHVWLVPCLNHPSARQPEAHSLNLSKSVIFRDTLLYLLEHRRAVLLEYRMLCAVQCCGVLWCPVLVLSLCCPFFPCDTHGFSVSQILRNQYSLTLESLLGTGTEQGGLLIKRLKRRTLNSGPCTLC